MQPIDHTQTIINLKNIFFSYNGVPVLEDINLPIHRGDYLGVIGPNGGGKTTLLKIMLGLLKQRSGEVELFGINIEQFKDWDKVGYVPQKAVYFDINFPITVEEVVSMGRCGKRGLFRFLSKEDWEKVNQALVKVEMEKYKKRLIGDLSGGQQQRVFIARALASEPEVIFLDEPTVGVDIKAQEDFYQLLEKLNSDLHLTLILVSHDIDVVASEATEVACLNKTLIYHGSPKEFIKGDYLSKLYGKGVKFIVHAN